MSGRAEYWTGLFAHGHGLCGTTHSQWTAEFQHLLGHARARGIGAHAHNSFEVFLTGGPYGAGRWALLDHDLSTVVFDREGRRLLSAAEVTTDWKRLTDRAHHPEKQHGWLVSGLHPGDGASFQRYAVAEYLPGYAGPPPMIHLRRGETLRRYLEPGLEDGRTFVFWGRNYNQGGVPGPARSITWVNQPENMFGSRTGAGQRAGRSRYGNAVHTYRPDFASGDYREGVVGENAAGIVLEFHTPYLVAATPPNAKDWGIYEDGCRNGLVLDGVADCEVAVSTDRGGTWRPGGKLRPGLDLTDLVKGHRQYWIRLGADAATLAKSGLVLRTVCQVNAALLPQLTPGESRVTFQASGQAVVSAGPTLAQARRHLIAGAFNSPELTLELQTPRGEPVVEIFAAAHVASGNPPQTNLLFHLEYSVDAGRSWRPIVANWRIERRGEEPRDFWSQSFCHGSVRLPEPGVRTVQIRFHNSGRRKYLRAEAHLVYRPPATDATRVTFAWQDAGALRTATQTFPAGDAPAEWRFATGASPRTRWVEFSPIVPGN